MAIMRRALGVRGARVPTVLNILQNTGWSAVETWTVAEAAHALPVIGGGPRIVYYLVAGLLGIVLAVTGPLGVVRRLLRRYVTPLLAVALAYLLVALLRDADLGIAATGGLPVMVALDIVVAYNASWLPLAPDYTRFSGRPVRAALGAATGYFAGTSLVFMIGFLVGTLGGVTDTSAVVTAVGGLRVRVARDRRHRRRREREDVRERLLDRRLASRTSRRARRSGSLIVAIGVIATVIAYQLSISRFFDFLLLLGAVFVPLFGAVIADHLRPPEPVATALGVGGGASSRTSGCRRPASTADLLRRAVDRRRARAARSRSAAARGAPRVPAFAVAFGLRLARRPLGHEERARAGRPYRG